MSALATIEPPAPLATLSPIDVRNRVQLIQKVMAEVMHEGEHYGTIANGKRKCLFQPGAQILCLTFQLAADFETKQIDLPGGHREYHVKCRLTHIPSGSLVGTGIGSCSSMESKYRWRSAGLRKCPECGAESIIKTKGGRNPGGYWCVPDKGGCGANFDPGEPAIEGQVLGRQENPDIADCFNTLGKMAAKRAHVHATLCATAASDMFTQDLEDTGETEPSPAPKPAPRTQTQQGGKAPPPSTTAATAAGNSDERIAVLIETVSEKHGEKNGKPWTMFILKPTEGREFATFSADVATRARTIAGTVHRAIIRWKPSSNGSLRMVETLDVETDHNDDIPF